MVGGSWLASDKHPQPLIELRVELSRPRRAVALDLTFSLPPSDRTNCKLAVGEHATVTKLALHHFGTITSSVSAPRF
jgi:hypothetical protein